MILSTLCWSMQIYYVFNAEINKIYTAEHKLASCYNLIALDVELPYLGPGIWNALPTNIKNITSLHVFLKKTFHYISEYGGYNQFL